MPDIVTSTADRSREVDGKHPQPVYSRGPAARDDVLIVGTGPTGLVLALWLTRLGIRVRIIDKTAEPGTTSRALAVQARTLEFYRQLGIADDVMRAGLTLPHANIGADTQRLRASCKSRRLPLHTFAWSDETARAGFARNASYLIRPDGYVTGADPHQNAAVIERYLDSHGLRS